MVGLLAIKRRAPVLREFLSTSVLASLFLGIALHSAAAARAATAALACTDLCGQTWQLDATASDDPATVIDAAMSGYKEEKPRMRRVPNDLEGAARAEAENSLGPMLLRPRREELRKELTARLVVPPTLRLSVVGAEILLDEARGAPRRYRPGEPHARVDSVGTANIRATWGHNNLVIREDYTRKLGNRETYTFDGHRQLLIVTRVLERPAMPDLTLRSVYRRAPT